MGASEQAEKRNERPGMTRQQQETSTIERSTARIGKAIYRHPQYRGVNTRRAVMVTITFLFSSFMVHLALAPVPDWRKALGAVFIAIIYVAAELVFVRRLGLTIEDDALTLHQLAFSRKVPWSQIEGFEWELWGRVELLVVKLDTGRFLLATTIWTVKNWLSWLGSSAMRSKAGIVLDPQVALERAWQAGLQAAQ